MSTSVVRTPTVHGPLASPPKEPKRDEILSPGVMLAPESTPEKHFLPKEVNIATLKTEISRLLYRRLENRYHIGRRLWQLQRIHAVAGHGTFLADLDELDLRHTTAYDYIHFYKRVELGYDPTHSPMTKAQRQKLQKLLDTTTEGPAPEQSEEHAADEKRAELAKAIATAKQQVEQAKKQRKGESGSFNVKFIFTDSERTRVKAIYKAVGIKKASQIYFEAMTHAEPKRKHSKNSNHKDSNRRGSVGIQGAEVRTNARR
jgi:hypothetical protein